MINENNKRFLRMIPFLQNLTEEELVEFFKHLDKPIPFKKGDAVCKEGSSDETSYIVLEGECDVYKTVNGTKTMIEQLRKTQVIGEMSEFLGGTRSASVVVRSPEARLLRISIKGLPFALRAKIRENQCRILAERLAKQNDTRSSLEVNILEIKAHNDQKIHELEENHREELNEKKKDIELLTKELKELRLKIKSS